MPSLRIWGRRALVLVVLVVLALLLRPPVGWLDSEPNDVLEANEVFEQRFTYVAVGRGTAEFTAHLHGTVDRDSLFPRGNGADATAGVEIKRPRN